MTTQRSNDKVRILDNSTPSLSIGYRGTYNIAPNLNGGSATLEYKPAGSSTWYSVDSSGVTDLLGENYDLPVCELRITVTDGSPTFEVATVEYGR